jgi:serine/threonine protein kinase
VTQSFGKYQLVKKLATGGMAEVWLAKQTGIEGFNRHIVLKRILGHLAEDPEFIAMFLQEARIASRFNHPNIAQIYDLGEHGGSYFIAMEYVHGEDLGRIMRRAWSTGQWIARPLAIRIVADAAAGLHYAHSRADEQGRPLRIVHRDVSPQNILVSFDGSVKLVDFGIAKAADQVSNTKSGAIKGKFAYMAPEQAGGLPLDARTDVFALGLVLYELITGVRPLKRDHEIATLQAALECKIEKPSLVADVPAELDDVVMRALAKDPDQRYREARQLQMALEQYLVQEGTVATSVQVSELMETLFADRLKEEARLGAPAPSTDSSTSNPIAESAHAIEGGAHSNTDLASNPGGAVRASPPGLGVDDRPDLTRDEDQIYAEPHSGEHDTLAPQPLDDDERSISIGGFQLPPGTVLPSRTYATSVGKRPTNDRLEAQRPRRSVRERVKNESTAEALGPVDETDDEMSRPRRESSSSMPEAPPRRSKSNIPQQGGALSARKSRAVSRSEVSKLVDVRSLKARQSGRLKALVTLVLVAGLGTLGWLFREPLRVWLQSTPGEGTPILLSINTKPKVRVQVIPPPEAGRPRLDLGESPLDRVSGAFVDDTILLINEERGIRYEEKFSYGQPNETMTITRTFEEGTISVTSNPVLKGASIWRGDQKIGQLGINIKLMEGHHELELRADSLDRPFPFDVTLKPREYKRIPLDVSGVVEKAAAPK